MEEKILDIIEDICGDPVVKENPDIDLLGEDLIDSLDYVEMLMDIQDQLGVVIAPSEVTREEMATPNKIIAVVKERMAR
ncbi:MAG: D-alanine--poly(phosphoribitol) ligase subunit 2 [Anaerovoracaceae bacterium]